MNNLFLTGKIGVGKSTIINKILKEINYSTGGYITEKVEDGSIKTFTIKSLHDNKIKYNIAKVNKNTFEKEIFIDNFTYNIPLMLDKDLKNKDLIILDELGFMENDIDPFTSKIYEILDSDKTVFGVLKDYDCEFLNNIRQRDDVIIIEITEDNRDIIVEEILSILLKIKAK